MLKRILLALAFLAGLSVTPAGAAPSLTHIGTNTATTGSSVSLSGVTIGAGNLVLVGGMIRTGSNADVTTITDSAGDTFTIYEKDASGVGSIRAFVGFAKTTGLSSGSVTVSTTGTVSIVGLSVESVSGFNSTAPEDTGVRVTAGNTNATPTITSGGAAQANDLLYSSFQFGNQTFTDDASWTNTANNIGTSNGKFATAYIINSGTGGVTRTGSLTSTTWRAVLIGIAPAPAASSAKSRTLLGVGQ